ncbi:MAG: AMP-binding protein, partial [Aquihabitans sp.]
MPHLTVERPSDSMLTRGDAARSALIEGDDVLTYGDLRRRVSDRQAELDLRRRSLVLLTGGRTVEWVVTYLALLDDHHVPLLGGDQHGQLGSTWNPDAVVHAQPDRVSVSHTRMAGRVLHPALALLLSTSGSTGSPKLVRLSRRNLMANADAIVDVLGLQEEDRGITSLPLHYCYGLSVLHAHLAAGASLVCTEASVVDPCFAGAVRAHQVTSVAGVPHSFAMLERTDPERFAVPSLRLLTCAGGAMPIDAVNRWSDRCERWGADLVLMYGQTEATARMAYLPPALARSRPTAIGMPIPGGRLRLDPVADVDDGVGELVYTGPNVMMGYAAVEADLASGDNLDELRTGDLARRGTDGLFEVVGRRSRFIKPFGVRV